MRQLINYLKNNKPLIFIIPAIVSGITGSICGSYEGFKSTRHGDYIYNVSGTIAGGIAGTTTGIFFGSIWPICVSVGVLRLLIKKKNE